MLHPLCLAVFLAPGLDAGVDERDASVVPGDLTPGAFQDLLDVAGRERLARSLQSRVVRLRRNLPTPNGFVVPGGLNRQAAALVLGRGRALTSSLFVQGWPATTGVGEDRLELVGADGGTSPAGVGLDEPHLGLAVVDLVLAVPADDAVSAAPPANALWPGRPLYAPRSGGGPGVSRVVVTGPGADPFAYFHVAVGDELPIGMPVFGSDGRFVTIVVRADDGNPGTVFLAPTRAIAALFARSMDWMP